MVCVFPQENVPERKANNSSMGSSSSEFSAALDQHAEDVLEALKRFDTVLVVDDSLSMNGIRWKQAGKALLRWRLSRRNAILMESRSYSGTPKNHGLA